MIRRHKKDSKTFKELSYADQSRSIRATILVLEREVRSHVRRASSERKDVNHVKEWIKKRLKGTLAKIT